MALDCGCLLQALSYVILAYQRGPQAVQRRYIQSCLGRRTVLVTTLLKQELMGLALLRVGSLVHYEFVLEADTAHRTATPTELVY